MDKEVAIKVEGVYKDFLLPHEKINSVKSVFTGLAKGSPWRTKETQHALKNISFEVKKGEFFGIVGRNGSGKSTLLKILANIYQPTRGSVNVTGRLVPFIELGVGFNGELTGKENIYLNGAMLGFSREEIDSMYDDIVSFAELDRFMDQKLKNYSSGMQVRLAFSLATRAQADILLVDEVLAVGDADFQRKCFDYFKKLKKNNKTVVFVSHDMNAIREYCDNALLIENNKIIGSGTADKIATMYTRLFYEPENSTVQIAKDSERWGDKSIQYIDVTIKPQKLSETNKEINIKTKFKVNKSVNTPIFGIRVKSSSGDPLMGTNTQILRYKLEKLKIGDTGYITWSIPNIFEDGEYMIDVAISSEDGITQYDWWNDAASFTSYRESRTPYIVSPLVDVRIDSGDEK